MKRKTSTLDSTQAQINAFLDAHYAHAHLNDIGPSLGRLASLREAPPADPRVERQWNTAVSLALTGCGPAQRPAHPSTRPH